MAKIQPYIDQIQNAVYGEEVRSSIINALEKVNDDNNSYADLKKEVIAAKDTVDEDVNKVQQKINAASTALTNLQNATSAANTAKSNLESATETANAAKANLTDTTNTANTAKSNVEAAIDNANTAKSNLDTSVNTANGVLQSLCAENASAASNIDELKSAAIDIGSIKGELDHSIETAGTSKTTLDKSVGLAGTAKTELDTSTQKAGEAKTALDGSAKTAGEMQETLSATVKQAGTLDTSLGEKIETGTQLKTDLTVSGEKAVQDIQTAGSEQLGKMQAVAEEFTADREQIATNKEDIGSLKEDTAVLQKRQNVLVGSETGNPVSCDDAFAAPLCGLTVYGKSTQDGTPTPDAPVPIVSAGDGGSVTVTLSDENGKTKTLILLTHNGLPGIPVQYDGNYTDKSGQQWVCDEVDLGKGEKVQKIGRAFVENCIISRDPNWFDASKSYSYQVLAWKEAFNLTIDSGGPCNRFIAYRFMDFYGKGIENGFVITHGEGVFNISKSLGICTTPDEFKRWFNENVVLYKILATPIETPLTPDEIAAYKALAAYAPDTVVQASDGAGMKLDYQRDVNIVIKKLEDAIASIAN